MQFTALEADSLYLLVKRNSDYGEGYVQVNASTAEIEGFNPVHRIYQGWGKRAGYNRYFIIKIEKAIGAKGTFAAGSLFGADSFSHKKNIKIYYASGLNSSGLHAGDYKNAGCGLQPLCYGG